MIKLIRFFAALMNLSNNEEHVDLKNAQMADNGQGFLLGWSSVLLQTGTQAEQKTDVEIIK